MSKSLVSGPILAQTCLPSQKPFFRVLLLQNITHCCKLSLYVISRKANEANLRKQPNPTFQMQFWPKFVLSSPQKKLFGVLYLQDFMHCYKLSFYAISRKTNETNLRKWQKTQFWDRFWNLRPKCWLQTFFVDVTSTRNQKLLQAIIVCNFIEN